METVHCGFLCNSNYPEVVGGSQKIPSLIIPRTQSGHIAHPNSDFS